MEYRVDLNTLDHWIMGDNPIACTDATLLAIAERLERIAELLEKREQVVAEAPRSVKRKLDPIDPPF